MPKLYAYLPINSCALFLAANAVLQSCNVYINNSVYTITYISFFYKLGRLYAGICDITKRVANHGPICKHCTCILHNGQCGNLKLTAHRKCTLGESCCSGALVEWSGLTLAVNMSECAVFGCKLEPGASLHYLPRNPVLKQKWMDFIYRHRFSRPSNTMGIRICCAHFSNDCFVNFFQRSMGFAKKLILKPGAVPSIYPGNSTGPKHVRIYFPG